jgi:bifunctional non-homologous end joining protein LigD
MAKTEYATLEAAGREVRLSNPKKVFFPEPGWTKLDVAQYYLEVGEAAVIHLRGRPGTMKRFVDGVAEEPFFQKRVPKNIPDWLHTATVAFPSGRTAEELVCDDVAHLLWAVNLGVVDFNPWPCRGDDLDHPDELRVDLDPTPEASWDDVRRVAMVVRDVLEDHGLRGYPKTSGSRGIHVNVRVKPEQDFLGVRRAALALAREVERRTDLATSKWWKEERHGVFIDYNQNAKDRTVAAAWSVRPVPDARVSTPVSWEELATCDPAAFTVRTVPERLLRLGDPLVDMDASAGSLVPLLTLADLQAQQGQGDAPWPPHYAKGQDEGPRAPPSKRRGAPREKAPLLVVARAERQGPALEGLERWKARHPDVAAKLAVDDVLVDAMRGRSTTWTRIRVNLRNVPEAERPPQETPDPDYDPKMEDSS